MDITPSAILVTKRAISVLSIVGIGYLMASSCQPQCETFVCEGLQGQLDFGGVELGQTMELTVRAENVGEKQGEVLVSEDGPHCDEFQALDALGNTLTGEWILDFPPGGGARSFTVLFEPLSVGQRMCTLDLGVCGAVELYGEGLEPQQPVGWYGCATATIGSNLQGVWASSETNVHVVGNQGMLLQHSGGCEWTRTTGYSGVTFADVWGAGSADVWAVGSSDPDVGHLLRFDGAGWSQAHSDGFVTYDAVWGSGSCDVYFGGLGIATDFPNAKYYDCAQFDTLVIEGGWTQVDGIWGSASDDIWVVMRRAGYSIWHGDKDGWTNETPAFADAILHDIWVAPTGEVFAVGEGGAVYHHDGSAWADQTIAGVSGHFYGVWGTSATHVVAVGQGGMIYQYDGNAWAPMDKLTPVTANLRAVFGISEDVMFAVGDAGTILFYGEQPQP